MQAVLAFGVIPRRGDVRARSVMRLAVELSPARGFPVHLSRVEPTRVLELEGTPGPRRGGSETRTARHARSRLDDADHLLEAGRCRPCRGASGREPGAASSRCMPRLGGARHSTTRCQTCCAWRASASTCRPGIGICSRTGRASWVSSPPRWSTSDTPARGLRLQITLEPHRGPITLDVSGPVAARAFLAAIEAPDRETPQASPRSPVTNAAGRGSRSPSDVTSRSAPDDHGLPRSKRRR